MHFEANLFFSKSELTVVELQKYFPCEVCTMVLGNFQHFFVMLCFYYTKGWQPLPLKEQGSHKRNSKNP